MSFCLPQEAVSKFIQSLKEGIIDPGKLSQMDSISRHKFFSDLVGEADARDVNALFESKLLLKNQQQGMVAWAKQVSGIKEPTRRDLISRIERMDKVLDPKEEKLFLEDLASKRLGFEVTYEEAKHIADFSKEVAQSKELARGIVERPGFDLKTETPEDRLTRTEYGAKLALFKEYIENLKTGETPSIRQDFLDAVKDPKRLPVFVGNLAKSIVASWDNSFFLNQGINALFDPKTTPAWFNAVKKSFGDISSALKGNDPMIAVKAEVYSRPNAINDVYSKAKLATGLATEEAIPTAIPEKIPVLGRFFKASNSAYNGAALRLRADIFDMKYKQAIENGINMNDKANLQSLGTSVNAFTGRGDTGMLTGENVNALVFSVKFAKSKFDVMTAHILSDTVSAYDKKQAAYSLLRMVGTAQALMLLSETMNPGSTDQDPRGTNFGKIKIGSTWYPTPLSFGGFPNLIARTLIPSQHNGKWGIWMKNSSGKFTDLLGGRYGQTTPKDIAEGYVEGKASPIVRAILDIWNGKDFNGNKSTPTNVVKNLVTPITIGSIAQSFDNPNEEYPFFNAFMTALGSNPSKPQ